MSFFSTIGPGLKGSLNFTVCTNCASAVHVRDEKGGRHKHEDEQNEHDDIIGFSRLLCVTL